MLYAHKFFKTEKAAQDFQKKHGGALYVNVPSSRTRETTAWKPAWLSCLRLNARPVWTAGTGSGHMKVLSALPQSITLRNFERAHIEDGLHPTAICDYAGPFIRLTTEE